MYTSVKPNYRTQILHIWEVVESIVFFFFKFIFYLTLAKLQKRRWRIKINVFLVKRKKKMFALSHLCFLCNDNYIFYLKLKKNQFKTLSSISWSAIKYDLEHFITAQNI